MKKVIVFLLLAAVLSVGAFSLAGCNDNSDVIIIGYDNGFPPMGFVDASGKDVGFDLDLATAVFAYLGKEIRFKPINWKLKETLLNSKEIDVIWNGYTITDARKEVVSFSMPYMKNSQCVVVKKDETADTIDAVKDFEIVVQSGSSAVEAMWESETLRPSIERTQTNQDNDNPVYEFRPKSSSNVTGTDTNEEAIRALDTGDARAAVMDLVAAEYLVTAANKGKFRVISEGLWDEEYGIGVRKEDTELLKGINEALLALKENGELARIAAKWGLEDALTDDLK